LCGHPGTKLVDAISLGLLCEVVVAVQADWGDGFDLEKYDGSAGAWFMVAMKTGSSLRKRGKSGFEMVRKRSLAVHQKPA
jgi:hypothetical protein